MEVGCNVSSAAAATPAAAAGTVQRGRRAAGGTSLRIHGDADVTVGFTHQSAGRIRKQDGDGRNAGLILPPEVSVTSLAPIRHRRAHQSTVFALCLAWREIAHTSAASANHGFIESRKNDPLAHASSGQSGFYMTLFTVRNRTRSRPAETWGLPSRSTLRTTFLRLSRIVSAQLLQRVLHECQRYSLSESVSSQYSGSAS